MKNNKNTLLLVLSAVVIIFAGSCSVPTASVFAEMGNPSGIVGQSKGGGTTQTMQKSLTPQIDSVGPHSLCDGTGLCSVNSSQSADSNAVAMQLSYIAGSPSAIILTFSFSELQLKQPNQVQYVRDPTNSNSPTTYYFGADFVFTAALIAQLSLPIPPGSKIPANVAGTMSVSSSGIEAITMPLTL